MEAMTFRDTIQYLNRKLTRLIKANNRQIESLERTIAYINNAVKDLDEVPPAYIKARIEADKQLKEAKARLNKLTKLRLDKTVYGFVISTYMSYMIDECIRNGYTFNLGNKLGTVRIIKTVRKLNRVDWEQSLINKKALIERGEQLWDDKTQTGTKWIVYHNERYNYSFKWLKRARNFKNSYGWYLKFTTGPNGVQVKALRYFKENPIVKNKHKLYEKHIYK